MELAATVDQRQVFTWNYIMFLQLHQSICHLQVAMKGMSRVVRILRNNPRYLCQYLVWTNILVFLYFVINADNSNTNIDHILVQHDQGVGTNVKESGATVLNEGNKFEHFELSKWNENQHFRLTDSGEELFT